MSIFNTPIFNLYNSNFSSNSKIQSQRQMNKKLNELSSKINSTRSSWQLELSSFSLIAQTAETSMEFLNFISYSFLLFYYTFMNISIFLVEFLTIF